MNILNRLTIKHLKMNKKRTIVSVMGIVLSTALMVGIGLLFSSVRDYMIKEIVADNGNYHANIVNVKPDQLEIITKNASLDRVYYEQLLGYSKLKESANGDKPYLSIHALESHFLEELRLEAGRLPKNAQEIVISSHLKENGFVNYQIGDQLTLAYGNRFDKKEFIGQEPFLEGETLEIKNTKKYTVVGIVSRSIYEGYRDPGYSVFTYLDEIDPTMSVNTYFTFHNPKNVYEKTNVIAKNLGKMVDGGLLTDTNYNDSLLALYGQSKYENLMSGFGSVLVIMLALVSVGCIVVIYNSFAISVMERKKQFGLFASIGTTKTQIRKTVFFEAILVGSVGIILGVLSGLLGIWIVIQIINQLLSSVFVFGFSLSIYPIFMIIPIIFMIVVILVSAYLPAHQASKITPIEAIRQNDDVKISSKKIKTNRVIKAVFGVEGEIALKNIKRNKRKYRITIVSLFISIVLFIGFSGFLLYGVDSANNFSILPEFDAEITIDDKDQTKVDSLIQNVVGGSDVKEYTVLKTDVFQDTQFDPAFYTKEYANYNRENPTLINFSLVGMDPKKLAEFRKKIGVNDENPILINRMKGFDYQNNSRVSIDVKIFDHPEQVTLSACHSESSKDTKELSICDPTLKNFHSTSEIPFGLLGNLASGTVAVVVSYEQFDQFLITYRNNSRKYFEVYVAMKDDASFDTRMKALETNNGVSAFYYDNYKEQLQMQRNLILVIKILLYGFISLVTLIGVTSVFNTINTSISLRRKEFAMLRSMGLTPGGFNKMIFFESLFFGVKSLLYALPVSIGIVFLIHLSMQQIGTQYFVLPWASILIAIVGVFLIVILTMIYATHKVKKENILDAIREENI